MNSVKEYNLVLNGPSNNFKFQLMNKEEFFKVLSNVVPEKTFSLDEILVEY